MKNIQVIDGAQNCTYSICAVNEKDFLLIFPKPGQDVEFVEDIVKRLGERKTGRLVMRSTTKLVNKPDVKGVHGTLFFGLLEKKKWYPYKRESDIHYLSTFLQE